MTTKSRPIIMSGDSVRAILENRKSQTRRVMKPQPPEWVRCWNGTNDACTKHVFCERDADDDCMGHWPEYDTDKGVKCPFGAPGDRLWVREAWKPHWTDIVIYKACNDEPHVWKNPMFMPRKYSRLTLEIMNVRCERVQEINNVDAILEGIEIVAFSEDETFYSSKPNSRLHEEPRNAYADMWNEINGKRKGCSWADNPFTWVIEFKKIEGGDNE